MRTGWYATSRQDVTHTTGGADQAREADGPRSLLAQGCPEGQRVPPRLLARARRPIAGLPAEATTSKTGGGPGTNQHQVRGASRQSARQARSDPPSQVVKRGDCAWPRGAFDDIWCLKHRQLAPELRQFMNLEPCVARLGPRLQRQALRALPDQAAQWIGRAVPELRKQAALRWSPDQLEWATQDEDWQVRWVAAGRMSPDQLAWAAKDPSERVRQVAARRMPVDELDWAIKDEDWIVRRTSSLRLPLRQLG